MARLPRAARIVPWSHWLLILALLAWMFAITPAISRVEASTAPQSTEQEAPDAFGPDLPSFCYAWQNRTATTQVGTYGVGPVIFVNWQVRFNGCQVYRNYVGCSAAWTAVSVRIDWCGAYQPAAWGGTQVEIGANWTECLGPISGVGACWPNYTRIGVNRNGWVIYQGPSIYTRTYYR